MPENKANILVVDDDVGLCEALSDILEHEGYGVLLANNGNDALACIGENRLDLVLLDLQFPNGIQGIDILKQALSLKPDLQIIIFTRYGSIDTAVETIKLGAYDFLEKPLDRSRMLVTVRNAIEREQLRKELNIYRDEVLCKYQMVGSSPEMRRVYELIEKAASSRSKILIVGESGVGKELVARAIHYRSPRSHKPFVVFNCAALPSELIESELFGIEKAVATGVNKRSGKFEHAEGGTIFLDEIGDLSASAQAKILRALENGEIQKVGGDKMKKVDVRIIAATNKNLHEEVKKESFREDLYYRLNVLTIPVPPLRMHRKDIPLLLDHFLKLFSEENNIPLKRFSHAAVTYLTNYHWEGNVRQLKNMIEKIVVFSSSEIVSKSDVLSAIQTPHAMTSVQSTNLREATEQFQREYILKVLLDNDWKMNLAAETLGIERTNLYKKMRSLGIDSKKY